MKSGVTVRVRIDGSRTLTGQPEIPPADLQTFLNEEGFASNLLAEDREQIARLDAGTPRTVRSGYTAGLSIPTFRPKSMRRGPPWGVPGGAK